MTDPGRDIQVMGILNLSEDSFYVPSRRDFSILESGADIIDIGAVSTRPGAAEVSEEREWSLLEPVLRGIALSLPDAAVSIDTVRSGIIERACQTLGKAVIVNDISAGEDDHAMLETAGRLGLRYIAMHKRGTPRTMQSKCRYGDVVEDVLKYFNSFALRASEAGVEDWILDPGFGFAKDAKQCFELLSGLGRFVEAKRPILVGISRKSFIYKTLSITPEEALPATSSLHLAALERGASILRVHDVEAARDVVRLYRSLHGESWDMKNFQ